MTDEIIEELWKIEDGIACEHGYDVDALVAHLNTKGTATGHRVVDLRATRGDEQERADTGKTACR